MFREDANCKASFVCLGLVIHSGISEQDIGNYAATHWSLHAFQFNCQCFPVSFQITSCLWKNTKHILEYSWSFTSRGSTLIVFSCNCFQAKIRTASEVFWAWAGNWTYSLTKDLYSVLVAKCIGQKTHVDISYSISSIPYLVFHNSF